MEQQNNPNWNEVLKELLGEKKESAAAENPAIAPHSTNSAAETIVDILAVVLLIGGIIGGIALIAAGADMRYGGEPLIIGGVATIVLALIQWAFLKVLCNISRNLFNINDFIRRSKH